MGAFGNCNRQYTPKHSVHIGVHIGVHSVQFKNLDLYKNYLKKNQNKNCRKPNSAYSSTCDV